MCRLTMSWSMENRTERSRMPSNIKAGENEPFVLKCKLLCSIEAEEFENSVFSYIFNHTFLTETMCQFFVGGFRIL